MALKDRLTRLERSHRRTTADQDCICFPPNGPPFLELNAEIEAAHFRCRNLTNTRGLRLSYSFYILYTLFAV